LTRLGFDPWQEAARLSDLPREIAARAFAVTIAMLPEGDWKASESEAIAGRSGELAAGAERAGHPIGGGRTHRRRKDEVGVAMWLAWGVLAAALLFLGLHLLGDNKS
jgi:hypothetical protein